LTELDLRSEAEKITANGFTWIAISDDKKPKETVVDKRGKLRTTQELDRWYRNGNTITKAVAIIIHYNEFAIDTDGEDAEKIFLTKIYPRFSKDLQNAIDTTTRTKTPHGIHRLFKIHQEDFPTGIEDHEYWQGKGDHAQILLRGRDHYLIERGQCFGESYDEIIGIENCVTLSKNLVDEFLKVSETVELEINVVKTVAKTLLEYYVQPNRDNLVFALSGDLHRHGVPEYLIHGLIDCLIAFVGGDEESEERHKVIETTCAKDVVSGEVSGYGKLLAAVDNKGEVVAEIDNAFAKLGYFSSNGNNNPNNKNHGVKKSKEQIKIEQMQQQSDYDDNLIEEYNLLTLYDTEEIWYYKKELGIFVPHAEPIIKARLERDFGYPDPESDVPTLPLDINDVKEHIGHIQRRTYFNREDFNPDISWIGCRNCMINLRTRETQEFSPKFLNTTYLPVFCNYITDEVMMDRFNWLEGGPGKTQCAKIMKFLHEIMIDSDVELLLDFLAYNLWREYKFNYWMLFNGAGQNGKSTLLNLIEIFLGKRNVSGESLERLLKREFTGANLYQKLANIDADLSADILLSNTGKIKKLTGNDEYPGEFKYQTAFKFRNYAKLWFSCNTMPQIDDTTDAFFRRLIIINFTQQFYGDKEDHDLINKLTTEEELTGLLNELLWRLPRVLGNGIRPTTSEIMENTFDKYNLASDPIQYFADNSLEHSSNGKKEPKKMVYESYLSFCMAKGLTPESDQSFSRKLTAKGFVYKQFRDEKTGDKPYCWIDVEIKDWKKHEDEKQKTLDILKEFTEAGKEAMK
jgi:putative DNA primase/helicase